MKTHINPFFFKKIANITRNKVLLLLILLNFTGHIVNAEESLDTARKLSESGQILSLEKITTSAKAIKPSEFLEIELERKNDLYIYEVEVLDQYGQVWELKFNAKTGKLIELERDN